MKNIITAFIVILTLGSTTAQNTAKISGSIGAASTLQDTTFFIVTLQCIDSAYVIKTHLNRFGQYSFDAIKGKSYRLSLNDIADGTKDPVNGVSTLDLVMIQRHILGISVLPQAKIIAADVTLDNRVTANDIAQIRKLLLGISQQFISGKSWIYVFAASIPPSTFPFMELLEISNLNSDLIDQNFIAIKLGDVNGNVKWP